jgi:EAL domain-containing protein (putative c-di-GMP-specific phosphodiesterase class I)
MPQEIGLAMAFLPHSASGANHPPLSAYMPKLGPAAADLMRTGTSPDLNFTLRFFPVYDFLRQTVAALFCTPAYERDGADAIFGHNAFHDVAPSDWVELDCAILAHALFFAARLMASKVTVAVGASVSFGTLCDPIGRRVYRDALRAARAREQTYFLLSIEDIPDQVDMQQIADVVSQLRSLVTKVWVHLPNSRMHIDVRDGLHASGLVLSLPPRLPAYGALTEARWLVRAAKRQTALACMDHVDSATELEWAREAGIRFVAGHALQRPSFPASALSGPSLPAEAHRFSADQSLEKNLLCKLPYIRVADAALPSNRTSTGPAARMNAT